jgi:serine phosphatase RsbU (regulator of sigma subunit)
LLIDDSFISLDTVSAFLENMGWTVLTAQNGIDALQLASTPDLDVVISDLNMPDMNGIEVFRRIYAMDPVLPVIILSDEGAMAPVLESVHAGVFDFVPKADHSRMLPPAVTRAVAHCRILRENQRLAQDLIRVNEGLEQRVAEQARLLEERLRREATLEKEAALASLRKEVEIARRIQTSILPTEHAVHGLQIAARMATASEVGGDYYDVRPTVDGCWLGIGDVAGHGLEAGLVMLMIQSGLSSLILHDRDALPHQILPALNRMLYQNLRLRMGRDDHATLTMLRFFSDGRLCFAGAHEDIIVCGKGGEIRTVPTHGTWVGISEDIQHGLESRTLELADGDLVVLYTDGIPEARSGHTCYGMPRLLAEVEKRHTLPVEEILSGIMKTVFDHCAGSLQDDATMLALRYTPDRKT